MFLSGKFLPHDLPAAVEDPRWTRHLSPERFLSVIGKLLPWLASGAVVLCALGLYIGFFLAPLAPRHGNVYRILYIHVPATWMAVFIYMLMACWAGIGEIFRIRLAPMMIEALAPTGTMFAFMALWTGSLWGKPIWGTWWVWDMRLIADLVLVVLYLAIVALHAGIEDSRRTDKVVAALALTGAVIVPTMLASVALWPATHPNPALRLPESSGNAAILIGLAMVAAGFWLYSSAAALMRLRCVILERERQSEWVALCTRYGR